jgi:hypothetical protein
LGNKKKQYLKNRINEFATKCKNKNVGDLYRGINESKMGYQTRSNLVKDENDDLFADSHNILKRWDTYFSQILNILVHTNSRK